MMRDARCEMQDIQHHESNIPHQTSYIIFLRPISYVTLNLFQGLHHNTIWFHRFRNKFGMTAPLFALFRAEALTRFYYVCSAAIALAHVAVGQGSRERCDITISLYLKA